MDSISYMLRRFISSIPIIFGVTFIAFYLMVHLGPDITFNLIGKNATQAEIDEVRRTLGYDQPFMLRYFSFLRDIFTLNFGTSISSHKDVMDIFKEKIPITMMVAAPYFIIGNVVSIILGLLAAYFRGRFFDKFIMTFVVIGMSISILIVAIGFQLLFCSSFGLNAFPVFGWAVHDIPSYIHHVFVPTLISVFVAVGYNTRFFRATFVEEVSRDHVRTARAYGCPPVRLFMKHVFKNSLIPIVTKIIFSLPFVLIAGNIVLESFFGIPGMGFATLDAIQNGDLPVVKAVVVLTACLYILVLTFVDIAYKLVDPRISLK